LDRNLRPIEAGHRPGRWHPGGAISKLAPNENFNKTIRNKQTSWRLDELAKCRERNAIESGIAPDRKNYSATGNWFTNSHPRSFPVCRIGVIDKEPIYEPPIFICLNRLRGAARFRDSQRSR